MFLKHFSCSHFLASFKCFHPLCSWLSPDACSRPVGRWRGGEKEHTVGKSQNTQWRKQKEEKEHTEEKSRHRRGRKVKTHSGEKSTQKGGKGTHRREKSKQKGGEGTHRREREEKGRRNLQTNKYRFDCQTLVQTI